MDAMDPEFAPIVVSSMACMLEPFDTHMSDKEGDNDEGVLQAVNPGNGHQSEHEQTDRDGVLPGAYSKVSDEEDEIQTQKERKEQ